MPLELSRLADLDPAKVQERLEFLKGLSAEEHPTQELRRGPYHDQVLYPQAQFSAMLQETQERLLRSRSLREIAADPTLADDEIVDGVMSNYNLARLEGARARGEATILVNKLSTVTVARGAVFVGQGRRFVSPEAYVARTSEENAQSDTDRVLAPTGDGAYAFTIELVAETEGVAGNLRKDDSLVPLRPVVNFVKAYAASDFAGGRALETNEELLARQREGLAVKTLSSRTSVSATLRFAFPDIVAVSTVGFGDPEMLRDQHSIFPGSFGGRADIYVRSAALPMRIGVTREATLLAKNADGSSDWQVTLDRDESPGFYDVEVRPDTDNPIAGSLEILSDTRSFDPTLIAGELRPDIEQSVEAAFSRFQTGVVVFRDADFDAAGLTVMVSKRNYRLTIRSLPYIAALQTLASTWPARPAGGDALVRAAIPCFLRVSFIIEAPPSSVVPDIGAIRARLAETVNSQGFPGRLRASTLVDAIHDLLSPSAAVTGLEMLATILKPTGQVQVLRSSDTLSIPTDHAASLSGRTCCFFLEPADVAVTVRIVATPSSAG